jgi:aryl-alcohol dehydrogenase-like predicted oxidoreductase
MGTEGAEVGEMVYRNLGRSGLKVSVVGLGCNPFGWRTDEETSIRVVHTALDQGINLFDTADSYSDGLSEVFLGKALGNRRDQAVIATKFGTKLFPTLGSGPNEKGGGARVYIVREVEESLRRLGTDYIDLYQMHWPDSETPIEETLSTLDDLVHAGKVRYIGTSNFASWQLVDADWTARVNGFERFVSAENHYSLLNRNVEADVVPACQRLDVGLLPYFPLASGLLTGKYRRGEEEPVGSRLADVRSPMFSRFLSDENFDTVEALEAFARERGTTLLHVAISGLAAQPTVSSVIASATRPEQVTANVDAATWVPTTRDLEEIDRIAPARTPAAQMAAARLLAKGVAE